MIDPVDTNVIIDKEYLASVIVYNSNQDLLIRTLATLSADQLFNLAQVADRLEKSDMIEDISKLN